MRYAIFSDVHANLEAFRSILNFSRNKNIDQYICAGDLVGYGPDPDDCIMLFKSLEKKYLVAGNHEYHVIYSDYSGLNPLASRAIQFTINKLSKDDKDWMYSTSNWTQQIENKAIVAHGSSYRPEDFIYLSHSPSARKMNYELLEKSGYQILFVGHTHSPALMEKIGQCILTESIKDDETEIEIKNDQIYMIDIGSVGQPRDNNNKSSFAIYDSEKNVVTIHRIEYDIEITAEKIIKSGLPEALAKRIRAGT